MQTIITETYCVDSFIANLNITPEPIYKNEVKLNNFTRIYLKLQNVKKRFSTRLPKN